MYAAQGAGNDCRPRKPLVSGLLQMPPAACKIGEVLPSCLRLCLLKPTDAVWVSSEMARRNLESEYAACPIHPPPPVCGSLGKSRGIGGKSGKVEKQVVD